MAYTIKWSHDHVVVSFSGQTDFTDIEKAGDDVYRDPRFKDCRMHIFDFCEAEVDSLSISDSHHFARSDSWLSHTNPNSRLTFISNDEYGELLTRSYQEVARIYGLRWQVMQFKTVAAALDWFDKSMRLP